MRHGVDIPRTCLESLLDPFLPLSNIRARSIVDCRITAAGPPDLSIYHQPSPISMLYNIEMDKPLQTSEGDLMTLMN
jgi:hypothetical protein